MCRPYCITPSFFFLSYLHFLLSTLSLLSRPFILPDSPLCLKGSEKLIFSQPPHHKTPTSSTSHLPVHSTSPFVFIFIAPLPILNDCSSFIRKLSPQGNEGIEDTGREAGHAPPVSPARHLEGCSLL